MPIKQELSKLVHPSCLTVATLGQTAFVLSVTATTWILMYFYSPSKSLRARYPWLNSAYFRVESFIQRKVDSLPYSIRSSNKVDWNRVVTSGAEAWIIRKPLIPFTLSGSIAFGVFCGSRFYNWRFGEPMNANRANNDNYDVIHYDENKEMVFGWNKIERAPSTDDWEQREQEQMHQWEQRETNDHSYNYNTSDYRQT